MITATVEILARANRITGRIRALISAKAMTASAIVSQSLTWRPGMIATVSVRAMNATMNETIIRRIRARRPGRHFQRISAWSL